MAVRTAGAFAQTLQTLFRSGVVGGLSDGELLDRFATGHREDAETSFRALMDRHGPMVLRACRAVLDDPHDAEDAFQATFLILARHPGSIRDRGSVASWLHRIAWRTAARARAAAARRREIERQSARPAAGQINNPERHLLDMIVHEELVRLPDKYRMPIVLCYLEGLTHVGAAEHLGWPVGTVRGRLARARDLLRERLSRRGVTAPAALAGVGWSSAISPADAALPAALGDTTVAAVLQVTSGQAVTTVVSARIAAMIGGTSRALALSRCATLAGLLLLVGAIGIGSGWAMGRPTAVQQQSPQAEHEPQAPAAKDQANVSSKQPGVTNAGDPRPSAQPVAQTSADRPRTGEVFDEQGTPVANAQVVLYSPPTGYGQGNPVQVQTTTDAEGKFGLRVPQLKRIYVNGVNLLAYRPGLAITAHEIFRPPHRLVLEKPLPRALLVEGPDGKPVAGARIMPRLLSIFGKGSAEVPALLAEPVATSTGADGRATLNYLAARDRIMAVRVSADAIGTQDILLIEQAGAGAPSEPSVITIKLKPTTHLAGRIADQLGQPIADQSVEVWSRASDNQALTNTVGFKHGPIRSAADGSFQTPENLMIGSTYRVAIRADGKVPVFSDWITMSDKPRHFPVFVLHPLRTAHGQVVDRQGKPIAGIEVFQAGDGLERTSTMTDSAGRFSLEGFRQGPVFVFARGRGFRFQGRLIKPAETDPTIELTRTSERPAHEMKMLGDPIPFEESKRLARRLAEPLWALVGADVPDNLKFTTLIDLASVDPARVLGLVETLKFRGPIAKARLLREVALALAPSDFEEASAVAESIDDDAIRSRALVDLADTLPHTQRERKLALLDHALLAARNAKNQGVRLHQMGDVAERWYELGQVDRAKELFALGLRLAGQLTEKTDIRRGWFAGRLALVDLPAALAIAKDFDGDRTQGRILAGIVFRSIDQNPAEAERVWSQMKGLSQRPAADALCWKMATVDPARARRAIESMAMAQSRPGNYLFLALGSKTRDPSASRQAFQAGLDGIDEQLREHPERYQTVAGFLLPIVERIDPGLVPEIFWRDVSSRLPGGNPRTLGNDSRTALIMCLAWYDREVARALFEPSRARLSSPGADVAAPSDIDLATTYWAWSIFDPRAAVAQLEKLPIDPKRPNDAIRARLVVAKSLAQNHEQRWHELWDRRWGIILGGTKREF